MIAGFSGIIVALDPEPVRRWSRERGDGLRTLLQVSGLVIVFSIAPLILGRWFGEPDLWSWALGAYGVAHVADVLSFLVRQTPDTPAAAKIGGRLGLAIAVAQVGTALLASAAAAEAVYLAVLMWHLVISGASFVYLLYTHDTERAS